MHIDLNSFFASAEQQANPFLRHKSMGVGKRDYAGSAILAASYEAKWQGIGLSTRLSEAKRIDPNFEIVDLDPIKYYSLHNIFIKILKRYSPIIEVYSIDEAFLDFTNVYRRCSLKDIAFAIKYDVTQEMGEAITCSIGIAPNKLLAKIASNHDKPDGITTIQWENRFEYLDPLKLEDVWGIGRHVSKKMYEKGINTVSQIRKLPDHELYAIVGGYYTRLRLTLEGHNFERVETRIHKKPAQSMQHAHTLDKATKDLDEIKSIIRKLIERLCIRLRRNNQKASKVYLGLAPANGGFYGWGSQNWLWEGIKLDRYTDHGMHFYRACLKLLATFDLESILIRRVVIAMGPLSLPQAITFDDLDDSRAKDFNRTFDKINERHGSFTLRSADILHQYAKDSELGVRRHEMRFHGNL